ncbi:hypothetical protein B5180_29005 [Streptomyces sp. BF-3]|nr:hypothetical protein B5180_29005 [Streptomyces sp. BF-3]
MEVPRGRPGVRLRSARHRPGLRRQPLTHRSRARRSLTGAPGRDRGRGLRRAYVRLRQAACSAPLKPATSPNTGQHGTPFVQELVKNL